MWDYSETLLDHFLNPRNIGEMDAPDAMVQVGDAECGEAIRLSLRIRDERIVDAKFKAFGCGSAIASASALTELVKGKTLEEASKITQKDIAEFLDGIPSEKMHCGLMGEEALRDALALYRGERPPSAEDKGA